jgi:hypothetical protein
MLALHSFNEGKKQSKFPQEIYLKKKDENMRALATLKDEMKDFESGRNKWVEPLREWILDTKQANFLSSSADFHEISSFVKKVGTNPTVRDKSARFALPAPCEFVASRRALGKVLNCDEFLHVARTPILSLRSLRPNR